MFCKDFTGQANICFLFFFHDTGYAYKNKIVQVITAAFMVVSCFGCMVVRRYALRIRHPAALTVIGFKPIRLFSGTINRKALK